MVLISCNEKKIYDEHIDIANSVWNEDSLASFEFQVPSDTMGYRLYYNVRYLLGYPFYNLYISYYLEDSVGNSISSDLQEIILFDRKTGEPLGDGLGDIFDREVLIEENKSFPYRGKYKFKVKQFMRTKDLPGIMSFGLRLEKQQ